MKFPISDLCSGSRFFWLLATSSLTSARIFTPAGGLSLSRATSLSLAYFGFVSVALFAYLGRPGVITRGRLYTSVSLYLILALFWFAVYNLMEVFAPGSFVQIAPTQATNLPRETLLYFSLATLTTLGYGDVVPVSHPARGLATLESASGVLYIAITVARLVAAYQLSSDKDAS